MRAPDHFDVGEDRPKLRTCDRCVEVEWEAGQFRRCEACDEVVCSVHSHGLRTTLCLNCGEDADARVCDDCGRENVQTCSFTEGDGYSEPRYQAQLCQKCVSPRRWAEAVGDEPDPDRQLEDALEDARW